MRISFKAPPLFWCSEREVTAAVLSIKKEDRERLSTSEKLKLSKAVREGGVGKFAFFASSGNLVSNFYPVYDLYIQIDALSKILTHFNMQDMFQVIPETTVRKLSDRIDMPFTCQTSEGQAKDNLERDPTNAAYRLHHSSAQKSTA